MRFNKKKILITLGVLLVLFVATLSTFYYFRDEILKVTLEKVAAKMERDFDSKFTIKTATFDGISAVNLTDVVLAPKHADTLFRIQKMKTSISFWHLLIGDVQLGTLEIQNGLVQLIKKGNVRNFDAFLKKNKTQEVTDEKRDYAALAKRIIFRLLNLVPSDMDIKNLVFKLDDNGKKATIDIKKLDLDGGDLESVIHVKTNTFAQRWRIAGEADPRDRTADIQFFNMDKGPIKVPYLDERFHILSSFDSIRLNVEN
ncbi:MAG: glycosyl transferase, partial [Flavobacterium sp.]|nr:glycosyl transferase [Flavobacterium sp.]